MRRPARLVRSTRPVPRPAAQFSLTRTETDLDIERVAFGRNEVAAVTDRLGQLVVKGRKLIAFPVCRGKQVAFLAEVAPRDVVGESGFCGCHTAGFRIES